MKRASIVIAVVLGMLATATLALAESQNGDHEFPEHPHILIQRPEIGMFDFGDGSVPAVVGVRKCVDLAGNRALPLGSHHQNVHFGTAGAQLEVHAGHIVAPTAPFPGVPWADCDDFVANFLPFPLPPEA